MWTGSATQTADEMYPELRRAVKLLAGLDPDRALERNDVGFNKIDGQFGHSLASQERWSPKQANAAYEMLRKYHRQLEGFGVSWSSIPRPQIPTEGGGQVTPAAPRPKSTKQVIIAPDGRFALKFSYDEGLLFKLKQHFRNRFWDKENKIWIVGNNEEDIEALTRWVVENNFEYSETAARALEGLQSVKGSRVEASKAASSDFHVEGLGGELRPFQRAGVEYVVRIAKGTAMIADEMGLGKTVEALAVIQELDAYPALIVVPASLKLNWEREARKWLPGRTINVVTGKNVEGDVVITNYDRLKNLVAPCNVHKSVAECFDAKEKASKQNIPFDHPIRFIGDFKIIVFDESHYLKNHNAQRSKLSAELAKRAKHKLLLTGTPVLNRPIELVHQLGVMGKLGEFGGFWGFAKTYCGAQKGRYGWDMTGATNLEEMNTKLRASCFIRRLKADVLSELPPKVRSTLPLPLDNMDTYERAEEELLNWIAETFGRAKAEKASQAEALVRISTLKKLAVQGKMAAIKDWVESFLETDQKLIIFAWHQDVIERLHREFPGSVVLTGQTSGEDKQRAVDKFQNDPECKLFIANIQAGGLGITLTAASNVAFVELGWNPSTHNQAEDRAHRIGQNDSVTAYYLIGENTIDEEILALIEAKRKVVDAATEGKVLEEGSFIDELMQKMLERHGRAKSAPVAAEEVEGDWY